MDSQLQLLKRQAQSDGSPEAIWRYTSALERLNGSAESDLKLYQVMGHEGGIRPLFHCIAVDEQAARLQFDQAVQQQGWGRVLWDHVFESCAGPVDGWDQPLHLLVSVHDQLPLQHIPKRANILTVQEVKLNTIIEFC